MEASASIFVPRTADDLINRRLIEKKNRLEKKTIQLVKPRFPSLWSGQEYDRWRVEVEKWYDNNKSTDEEKYIDFMESLKKNENIKEFVNFCNDLQGIVGL